MTEATSLIQSKLQEVGDASKQVAAAAKETLTNAANYVADQSRPAVAAASENLSRAASYINEQAENATDALSGGLKSAAKAIRDHAPEDERIRGAATGVAQKFSNAASYLDRQGFEGITTDLRSLIKNNPLPSLVAGIALGYLVALASRPRK